MIINTRKDLDNAPQAVKDQFMVRLGAGINRWSWDGSEWVLIQDTTTIDAFGFSVNDFPNAPVPEKPDYNPDERALEQERQSASLSRMQFMLSLETAGLYEEIQAAIDSDQVSKTVKIMWQNASRFERMNPELVQLGHEMGYTDQQMDNIFGIEG